MPGNTIRMKVAEALCSIYHNNSIITKLKKMITHTIRLKKGDDLKESVDNFISNKNCRAACILTCVGSLNKAVIRFANQVNPEIFYGNFEIISLAGTLSFHGSHLHIAIADERGSMIGGHLKEGSIVFTTAEIVIGIIDHLEFLRVLDNDTGFKELVIKAI